MRKNNISPWRKKRPDHTPEDKQRLTELTDQDLEQVQGGQQAPISAPWAKVVPPPPTIAGWDLKRKQQP